MLSVKNILGIPRPLRSSTIRSFNRQLSSISKVGVIGLGLMGHGIAQISASSGYKVTVIESNEDLLAKGMDRINNSLDLVSKRGIKKGTLTPEEAKSNKQRILSNITTKSCNIEDIYDCDLIVEAIIENMDIKLDFYKNLKEKNIVKDSAIIGSNTSSLQITKMAEAFGNPDKFVGLHFFNPVQIMKLVEIVKTKDTSASTLDKVTEYTNNIGKTSVTCTDTPGFIVNRLLVPYLAQAMAMVDREVASLEDIDTSMKLGAGHPMGPLHLADYIGLDTCHSILVGWTAEFPDEPAFIIPKCLDAMIKQGHHGRKTGQGFYKWEGDKIVN